MPSIGRSFRGFVILFGGIVIVLVLLQGYENVSKSFRMVCNRTETDTKYSICIPITHMLKHISLPIKMDNNVDKHQYERSGCFVINTNESGIYRILNERNFIGTKCLPIEKRFLNNSRPEQMTALASIPGSGNTWTRHLIEDITGIYTGSLYTGRAVSHVFKGEHRSHDVIAVKTHNLYAPNFSRAIIIVRDPFESTLAEYNRQKANKTSVILKSQFNKTDFKRRLNNIVKTNINVKWINSFQGDLFILYYDKLKTDLANSLTKLAAFLHSELSLERLWCTLNNKEGSFKRVEKPKFMSRKKLVDENMERRILKLKEAIHDALMRRKIPYASN